MWLTSRRVAQLLCASAYPYINYPLHHDILSLSLISKLLIPATKMSLKRKAADLATAEAKKPKQNSYDLASLPS